MQTISPQYKQQQRQYHEKQLHAHRPWGVEDGKWFALVLMLLHISNAKTVLDYGAGQGVLAKKLRSEGIDVTEYDPGIPAKETKPEGTFDFVVCADVLEHIEPAYIENVLNEIDQYLTVGGLLIPCLKPARKHTLPDGRNAHVLIRSRAWWINELEKRWDTYILKGRGWHSRELVAYIHQRKTS